MDFVKHDRDMTRIPNVDYSALSKWSNFRISDERNKMTAVGCDAYSFIQGSDFTTGCLSLCGNNEGVMVNGSCSGIGCCQTVLPPGRTIFNISVRSLSNVTNRTIGKGECAYGFIVEEKAYNFLSSDFQDLKDRKTVPLMLDWAIGNETCKDAIKHKDKYACKANHSYCYKSSNGPGYRCNCSDGYQDINERMLGKPCAGNATCINTDGSYRCFRNGRIPPARMRNRSIIPNAVGSCRRRAYYSRNPCKKVLELGWEETTYDERSVNGIGGSKHITKSFKP